MIEPVLTLEATHWLIERQRDWMANVLDYLRDICKEAGHTEATPAHLSAAWRMATEALAEECQMLDAERDDETQ